MKVFAEMSKEICVLATTNSNIRKQDERYEINTNLLSDIFIGNLNILNGEFLFRWMNLFKYEYFLTSRDHLKFCSNYQQPFPNYKQ